eukprot:TRINITY_DN1374_c0_g1_i8.p1 TRINITY_DN1374_c0_g1~~TRINITY_DN1374_c0_g1_i8.p1  ORF type:complete len:232 (+),score=30.81 TRINITY_DN1374_c0_g1_i8:316-1011(+)
MVLDCKCDQQSPPLKYCVCQPPMVYLSDAKLRNLRLCTFVEDINNRFVEHEVNGKIECELLGQRVKDKDELLQNSVKLRQVLSRPAALAATPFALLTPAFTPSQNHYTVTVGAAVTTVALVPTALAGDIHSISVDGTQVASATISELIPVPITAEAGKPLSVSTVVTAQDGSTRETYMLEIHRPNAEEEEKRLLEARKNEKSIVKARQEKKEQMRLKNARDLAANVTQGAK